MKCSLIIALLPVGTSAFTPSIKPSPLATEAIQIYKKKYSGSGSATSFFFDGWGMPESYTAPENKEKLFDAKDEKLRATFNTIAKLYGEENALKMTKIQPGILAFNKDNFAASLDAFGETFGAEEAKDMVIRNPGLLSVKPANAATADDLTMQLSYVVEVTRPIGAAGPIGILALLSVPVIEGVLGMSRGELLASLF